MMAKDIDITEIMQTSFRLILKKPLLIGIFSLATFLSLIMFMFSLLLLTYSMHPVYLSMLVLSAVMAIFSLWVGMIGASGIVLSVEMLLKRQKIDLTKIFEHSLRISWKVAVGYSLEQIFLIIGFMFFIIPGLFLGTRLAFVVPAVILENKGFGIKESWLATRKYFWKIFLILIIWDAIFVVTGLVPFLIISSILLLPVYIATLTILYSRLRRNK